MSVKVREWLGGYPWTVKYGSWASWRDKPSHFRLKPDPPQAETRRARVREVRHH